MQPKRASPPVTIPEPTASHATALTGTYPASRSRLATTAASIYITNLNSRIETIADIVAANPDSIQQATLATLLYYRYRIVGKIEDAERALVAATRAVVTHPTNRRARHVRATILSGMHLFEEALSDLERAREADFADQRLAPLRREIMLALGHYDEVPELDRPSMHAASGFHHAVLLGNLELMKGRVDLASARFLEAQQLYADSSPFQLAWLYTQQGIALLRSGNCPVAERFFQAALARMPMYYVAAEHLAECERAMGQLDSARRRYLSIIEQTDNPEFIGALAELEREAGNQETADKLTARAEEGWNELLARHPQAFTDHAAKFFIASGDARRALALSYSNMENRNDVLSLLLHASANFEAERLSNACRALRQAIATGMRPPEILEFEERFASCDAQLSMTASENRS
ncbi:MAG: hypothetical protein LC637_13320 [Xanthomonadaceae bacterium]|nr:hypothetical protein [Xanthomonadaceae bacterium]